MKTEDRRNGGERNRAAGRRAAAGALSTIATVREPDRLRFFVSPLLIHVLRPLRGLQQRQR